MVGERILGELKAGDYAHAVLLPGALGFCVDEVDIGGEGLPGQSAIEPMGGDSEERFFFAEMVGDGDGSKASGAVQVDDLWNSQVTVGKC